MSVSPSAIAFVLCIGRPASVKRRARMGDNFCGVSPPFHPTFAAGQFPGLAVPLCAMPRWLNGYAYRTDRLLWLYPAAGAAALILAVARIDAAPGVAVRRMPIAGAALSMIWLPQGSFYDRAKRNCAWHEAWYRFGGHILNYVSKSRFRRC